MKFAVFGIIVSAAILMMIDSLYYSDYLAVGQLVNQISTEENCGVNPFSPPCLQDFSAQLNGSSEVPPVDTQAAGSAVIKPINNETGQAFQYNLSVTGMTVTAAHIHSGKLGENGQIVVTLLEKPGIVPCCIGTITADNLEGQLQGKTLVDFIKILLRGETYVNVHSERHPDGEIRGQIWSSSNMTVTDSQ